MCMLFLGHSDRNYIIITINSILPPQKLWLKYCQLNIKSPLIHTFYEHVLHKYANKYWKISLKLSLSALTKSYINQSR